MNLEMMTNNDVFQHMLYLTGLNRNNERLVQLLAEKGCNSTKAQIRSWRRKLDKNENARPCPDFVLLSLFRILFDEKNKNPEFCQYPEKIEDLISKTE